LRHWANNHPMEATVDHYPIPLSKGGDHDWHNVKCAHRKCNSERGNKWDGQRRLAFARS
jgi:5-methylcytosine-specific restriction endonuclease McrA